MNDKLKEGVDYYYNECGYVVLTAKYHQERGYCCGNGCRHCPFDFERVPEPRRTQYRAAQVDVKVAMQENSQ